MADRNIDDRDQRFEEFLERSASDPPSKASASLDPQDAWFSDETRLQTRIDDSLKRQFETATPSPQVLAALLGNEITAIPADELAPKQIVLARGAGRRAPRYAMAMAAAALIAVVLTILWRPGGVFYDPAFVARPLISIYDDALKNGFEPTYDCHEPARFAAAFSTRQGRALRLLPMPENAQMLGLAFAGGLSRSTTAMLCYVETQPVMVFVDRAAEDRPSVAAESEPGLHIFREERHGLVFYEVTPLAEPRVSSLIVPQTGAGLP